MRRALVAHGCRLEYDGNALCTRDGYVRELGAVVLVGHGDGRPREVGEVVAAFQLVNAAAARYGAVDTLVGAEEVAEVVWRGRIGEEAVAVNFEGEFAGWGFSGGPAEEVKVCAVVD